VWRTRRAVVVLAVACGLVGVGAGAGGLAGARPSSGRAGARASVAVVAHPRVRRCHVRRHGRLVRVRCRARVAHRPGPAPRPAPPPVPIPGLPVRTGVDEGEYFLNATHPTVAAGTVELDPANLGMDEHNMTVRNAQGQVLGAVTVEPGQTQQLALSLAPGSYTVFCSLYNHEALGMHTTLTVR